ncbi:ectonucleotide pyrophosphatase/phosphodiesterase [Caulobacter sp. NIBR1757]|uniref:alkaline phosphatase family protein n=1 Tax=Caulobacter sp. NIBR1757 TaxID=3016000 RepID=UPI0022F0034B|nr:ectonucleotide pyrophosphatase/phosphodiesterase [Caulobacter sp. NIBR1757]
MAVIAVLVVSACATAPARQPGPRPMTILVSIDGFRPDYLTVKDAPTLSRLAAEGVVASGGMRPSYPSLTFPNHYTLVTGKRPDHHGIVNNNMDVPVLGTFSLGKAEAVTDRRWWDQAEPLWVTAENAGIKTGTMFWPGSEAAIQGVRPTRWSKFDHDMPSAQRVDVLLGWLDEPGFTPGFATLYFDVVDTAGHGFAPGTPEVMAAVKDVDTALSRLLDGLKARGLDGRVNLVIVADHGMAPVPPGQVIVVDAADPGAVKLVSGGPAAGFNLLPGQEARGEALLLKKHDHMTCWRKADVPKRLAYGTNARVPAIVCMADIGWLISDTAGVARRPPSTKMTGAHGYDNAAIEMRALFLAWGPGVRSGATVGTFDNVDVYVLLARLVGVTPVKGDGRLPSGVLR